MHDAAGCFDGVSRNLREGVELDRRRLRGRDLTRAVPVIGIADRRRAQIEPPMRLHPHRIQELAAEELQPYNAGFGIVMEVFLQQEQVVGQPDGGIGGEDRFDVREGLDDLYPCTATALVGFEQRRPCDLVFV